MVLSETIQDSVLRLAGTTNRFRTAYSQISSRLGVPRLCTCPDLRVLSRFRGKQPLQTPFAHTPSQTIIFPGNLLCNST